MPPYGRSRSRDRSRGHARASAVVEATPPSTSLDLWINAIAAKTTLNGSNVSALTSRDAGARVFSQGTAASQPGYLTPGIGSLNSVNFLGTDDHLKCTAAASAFKYMSDGTGFTLIAGVELGASTGLGLTVASTLNAIVGNTGTACRYDATNQRTSLIVSNAGTNLILVDAAVGTVTRSAKHVLAWSYLEGRGGNEYALYCDSTTPILSGNSTSAPGSGDPTSALTLGCYGNGSTNPFIGELETLLIYTAYLDTASLLAAMTYVGNRIGVTIT